MTVHDASEYALLSRWSAFVRIFLSYSARDRGAAEQVSLALGGLGHRVFFDRESLPPGGDYHSRIRQAVSASDAFIFLVSPNSVSPGSYTLTELKYAREKWPHPKGRVLPVLLRETAWDTIPSYLRAVTVLEPQGNTPAEVAAAVRTLGDEYGGSPQRPATPLVPFVAPIESFMGDTGQMHEVAFSPDGETLATWGFHEGIHLWDLQSRRLRGVLEPWPGGYGEPRFSPDSRRIVVLANAEIHVCQLSIGLWSTVWQPDDHEYLPTGEFTFSPAGDLLVAGWQDYSGQWGDRVLVFRTEDWTLQAHFGLDAGEDWVRYLSFSPDGTKLAAVLDSKVQLLSAPAFEPLQVHSGHSGEMLDCAVFSGDGSLVASCSSGGSTVDIWRSYDGELVQRIEAHIGGVVHASFLHTTGILVTGGLRDGLVRFWQVFGGALLTTAEAAKEGVFSLALSPDGTMLATGGSEPSFGKCIRLWKIR